MLKMMALAGVLLTASTFALADSKTITWKDGSVVLKGQMFLPEKRMGTSPGVLVFPDWLGNTEEARMRASQLAGLGYVALVVDMYGEGKELKSPKEAMEATGPFYKDRKSMIARAKAALEALAKRDEVNPKKVAAVGFCFGGANALQLARSGADLKGVVSLHGGLKTELPAESGAVKARLLVLHGALDPHVPPTEVAGFFDEMNRAGAKYSFTAYSGAVHSFTRKSAGTNVASGAAYNEEAALLAWKATGDFLAEILPVTP